jgi:hypothetical protein
MSAEKLLVFLEFREGLTSWILPLLQFLIGVASTGWMSCLPLASLFCFHSDQNVHVQ